MLKELVAFEESIADDFNNGKIPYPVHLESGNEERLIEIFMKIRQQDWVFGSWRMHLKALLKHVPEDDLRAAIYRGESMSLRFPEHKVYGSAIVGGIIPIALGTALDIRRRGQLDWVYCFLGDMTSECGIFHEALKYGANHCLPICWVIEDNGMSVVTPTKTVWGDPAPPNVIRFSYHSKWPHAGAGQRVQF